MLVLGGGSGFSPFSGLSVRICDLLLYFLGGSGIEGYRLSCGSDYLDPFPLKCLLTPLISTCARLT